MEHKENRLPEVMGTDRSYRKESQEEARKRHDGNTGRPWDFYAATPTWNAVKTLNSCSGTGRLRSDSAEKESEGRLNREGTIHNNGQSQGNNHGEEELMSSSKAVGSKNARHIQV